MAYSFDLGKNPFKKFTKSALIEMLEEAAVSESKRSKMAHKRGDDPDHEKDESAKDEDDEREKLADLHEESHGKPTALEMTDEDMSDESMDTLKKRMNDKPKKPTKPKKA
jgi:hypothetical protein